MLTTEVEAGTNLVTIEYSGSLDAEEMKACRRVLERVVDEHGSVRLLARYGEVDVRHIEPKAIWEDLKNIPVIRHVERCAIVAHQDWLRRISDLAGHAIPGEIRTFDTDQVEQARAWVMAG